MDDDERDGIVNLCMTQMERDLVTVAAEQAMGIMDATTAHALREHIYAYQKILKRF
jgi:hypothetical protein